MRADTKVGVVVGVVVVVILAWYFWKPSKGPTTPLADQAGRPSAPQPAIAPAAGHATPRPAPAPAAPSAVEPAPAEPSTAQPPNPTLNVNEEIRRIEATKPDPVPAPAPATKVSPLVTARELQAPAPPLPRQPITHVVQADENFSVIARQYYPRVDAKVISALVRANPDVDPTAMKIGSTVIVPPLPTAEAKEDNATAPAPPGFYRVKSGQNFWTIAQELYGDPSLYQKLLDLNRDLVGGDATDLRAGQLIRLLPRPSDTSRADRPGD